jgi:hypothetical protein
MSFDETRQSHQRRIASLGGRTRRTQRTCARASLSVHRVSPSRRPVRVNGAYWHTPASPTRASAFRSAPIPVPLHRDPRNACHWQALGIPYRTFSRLIRQGVSDSGTDRADPSTGAISLASHLRSLTYV